MGALYQGKINPFRSVMKYGDKRIFREIANF